MSIHEKSITVNNNTIIDYVRFGKGKKPMLIIPGLNTRDVKGAGFGLWYMYRMFAKDYTVYCIDRRRDVPEGITTRQIAEDYAAAMKALHIENAYVFGVSHGGMIAQYLAIEHPELVKKLVLAVTASRVNDTIRSCISRWVDMTQRKDYKALNIDTMQTMYSAEYNRRNKLLIAIMAAALKPANPLKFIRLAKSILTADTYERLNEIHCPVLVLGGKLDQVTTAVGSEEIAAKLGCHIYMYDNLGHAAYDEGKDFNKRVFDFFAE